MSGSLTLTPEPAAAEPTVLLPPGYEHRLQGELVRRHGVLTQASKSAANRSLVLAMCAADVATFVDDWVWTYDPRLVTLKLPATIPFALRPRQREYFEWLRQREESQTSGLVEKSRDEGFSFLTLAYCLHRWLFTPGWAGAVGSRKQELVDKLGDPKTLLWKFRFMLYSLPPWFLPAGFSRGEHDNFLRILNPKNGATLTGEGGDNMGRGGRASMYVVDEWAFVERADNVEAAISQNSNVRIKGSTPRGVGDRFYVDRFSGKYPVFTFNWRDNPDKNYTSGTRTVVRRDPKTGEEHEVQEPIYPWYEKQRRELDEVTLAQEVDIDYNASAKGAVIPAKWVRAAIGLALEEGAVTASGLDISEDGDDETSYAHRRGGCVMRVVPVEGTPGQKTREAERLAREDGPDVLHYDKLGVGAGITATLKDKEEELPFEVQGVSNAGKPTRRKFEDQPKVPARERFADRAAEEWWALRLRFWRTYQRVEGEAWYEDDECISIPNDPTLIAQLSQPTYHKDAKDKIHVDKAGEGTKSPDRAESVLYAYWSQTGGGDLGSVSSFR